MKTWCSSFHLENKEEDEEAALVIMDDLITLILIYNYIFFSCALFKTSEKR